MSHEVVRFFDFLGPRDIDKLEESTRGVLTASGERSTEIRRFGIFFGQAKARISMAETHPGTTFDVRMS